ncbi:valine--tRNA ligase, putative [Plasmodium vivax]|uniref:valine--tRNA ligase n=1 Tax=Plasmodium vivax TaxID=5855 RepID=A0A1G4GWP0_PLAVI|nr:valine--tRNA ligase, putative [Plasmodium vivax]
MRSLLPHLCMAHLCLSPSPVEGRSRGGLPTGANLSPPGGEIRPPAPVVVPNRVLRIRYVANQLNCCRRPSECPPAVTCDYYTSGRKSGRGRPPHRGALHFVEGTLSTAAGRRRKKKASRICPTTEEKPLSLRLSPYGVLDPPTIRQNESRYSTVTLSGGAERRGDPLEELYQRGEARRSASPKYAFFKNAGSLLGLEKIYRIATRRWSTTLSWGSLLQEELLLKHISQVDDLKGLYSEEITTSLYALKQREEKRYLDRFSPSQYANAFIFLFPPPNLSGELHAGHYFNFVQLHVLLLFSRHIWSRYSLALYGADHGGLSAHAAFSRAADPKWTREKHISEMKRWQEKLKEKILTCMQKMNIAVDRSRFYSTMSGNMKQLVTDTFYALYRNDLIVKRLYPVYYCPPLGTIISKLDVEFRETLQPRWRVTLRLVDGGEESHVDTESDSPHGDNTPPGVNSKRTVGEQSNCRYPPQLQQTNEVKFFPQSSHHFFYLKNTHEVPPEVTPSESIHVEVTNLEDLKRVVAILYFSPKKEKRYRGKYALLPLLNKGVPLICSNERNVLPLLGGRKTQEEGALHELGHGQSAGDVFIPVFSKEESYNHYANGGSGTNEAESSHWVNREKRTVRKEQPNCQTERRELPPLVEHLLESGLAKVVTPRETQLKCAFYKNNECMLTLAEQWCLRYEKLSKIFFDGPHGGGNRSYRIIPSKYGGYFTGAFPPPSEWTLSRQVPHGHPVPLFRYEPPGGGLSKKSHLGGVEGIHLGEAGDAHLEEAADAHLGTPSCYIYGNDVEEAYQNLCKLGLLHRSQVKREFLKREEDVLDSWFSSCLYILHCIKEMGVDLPHFLRVRRSLVDFLLTGRDILQPWVVRSFVLLSYVMERVGEGGGKGEGSPRSGQNSSQDSGQNNRRTNRPSSAPPPLAGTVKFHGLLKDQAGRKISKSETNATHYEGLVREANVDQVRLSFCFIQRDTEDVHLSENVTRKSSKLLAKLWSIAKYIREKCPPRAYERMDRWSSSPAANPNVVVLTHLEKSPRARISNVGTFRRYLQMVNAVLCEMKDYNVGRAINLIFSFVVNVFSKFYLTLHSGGDVGGGGDLLDGNFDGGGDRLIGHFDGGGDLLVEHFLPAYILRGVLKIVFPFAPHIAEVLFIRLFRRVQKDNGGTFQPLHGSTTPLSSNYQLMKNETPPQLEEQSPLDRSFDAFMQIYTLLAKYKKGKSSPPPGRTFHVYLKQNYEGEVPLEYFKNEEAFLAKSLGVNVRFSLGCDHRLAGSSPGQPLPTWEVLHDGSSFTIAVGGRRPNRPVS